MKKIIIVVLFLFSVFLLAGCSNKRQEIKESFNKGQEKAREAIGEKTSINEYSQQITDISKRMSEALNKRSQLAIKWSEWTDNEETEFNAAGTVLEGLYGEANKLKPPEIMTSVHQKILKGLDLFRQSVSVTKDGLSNNDAVLIDKSTSLIQKGTEYIKEATKETDEITAKLNQ